MYSISFTPSLPFSSFWGLLRMVPTILFKFFLWCFLFLSISLFNFLFNLTRCLWFDLHRHLFLLVLFLLCGCDYNQEMEIQKSTCCHSKYVLFHLLDTLLITLHPPCLVCSYTLFLCMASLAELFLVWTNPLSGAWDCSAGFHAVLWTPLNLFLGVDGGYFRELLPLLFFAMIHCKIEWPRNH